MRTNSTKKLIRGFTLVEIVIVIAISIILGVVGTVNYLGVRDKKALDNSVQRIVEDLRTVASQSVAGQGDSQWGIRFINATSDSYHTWKGSNYASGEITSRSNLGGGVSFTDPAEGTVKDVIFSRGTGLPTILDGEGNPASSTLTLSNRLNSRTITINSNGRVDY